ncbi:MAG: aminotransferase class I/II-fold pyridoxal phosphate-dependent enzyme [Solirubrobacteraceae bacterium]
MPTRSNHTRRPRRAIVRLDGRESPFGTNSEVLRAWERQRTADIRKYGLNRYPDFFNTDMLRALSAHHGLSDANYTVLADVGEGANVLAAALLRGRGAEVVEQWPIGESISGPGRAWGAAVRRVRLGPRRHGLAALTAAVGPRTRLVHVQNPRDPTGESFGQADLERLLATVWKRNPASYVWVDESWAPYSARADFPNTFQLIGRNPERSRLIVTRTIGSAGGVAGDPTAYMAASQQLTYETQGVDIGTFTAGAYGWKNPECCVDRMGEKAMLALLTSSGDAWLRHVRTMNAGARRRLVHALHGHLLEILPSDASFVLARVPRRLGGAGFARALARQDVLVRGPRGWGPAYRDWVRISVGNEESVRRLDAALGVVLGTRGRSQTSARPGRAPRAERTPAGIAATTGVIAAARLRTISSRALRQERRVTLELTRRQLIARAALGAGAGALLGALAAERAGAFPPDAYYDQHSVARMLYHENPAGPSPAALEAIREVIGRGPRSYGHLQDDDQADLVDAVLSYNRKRSAAAHRLKREHVMLLHGSAEGLTLAADTFVAGGTIISEWPAYYVVRQRVWQAGGTVVDVPLLAHTQQPDYAALKQALRDHPHVHLVHFNVQNNPAGPALQRAPFDAFCRYVFRRHPHTVILADESDHEFMQPAPASGLPDFASYVAAGKNLVHLQTFSHAFALTGLRIGYLFAPPRLIGLMRARRIPRPVNVFGHAAALATLADRRDQIRRSFTLVDEGRDYLYAELNRMGLRYLPSQGQYVMVDTARNGDAVWSELWTRGVLTRAGSTWDMDSWIRVCPGQPDENRRFIDTLRIVLARSETGTAAPTPPRLADNSALGAALARTWRRDRAIRSASGPPKRPYRVTTAAVFTTSRTP